MTNEEAIGILESRVRPKTTKMVNGRLKGGFPDYEVLEQKDGEEDDKEVCEWVKYDYRTVAPRNHDINNPYWRIPENRMDALKYCPYCGKKIEVKE